MYNALDYKYRILTDGTVEIADYTGGAVELEVPSEIDGHKVTSIGEEAFSGCDSITSVKIPDGVTSIGDYAFGSCYDLISVAIPDSVTNIGKGSFYDCISLENITIPDSVENIGDKAFSFCGNLKTTIKDIKQWCEGQYTACEIYRWVGKSRVIHTENITEVTGDIAEDVPLDDFDYEIMYKEEYNDTILANSCVDFEEIYDEDDKVLVIVY